MKKYAQNLLYRLITGHLRQLIKLSPELWLNIVPYFSIAYFDYKLLFLG